MAHTKATFKDVGFIAVPADNSHSMNLATFDTEFLVGKEVKILSRPFQIPIITMQYRLIWGEFVIVRHQDSIVRILNRFSKITNEKT